MTVSPRPFQNDSYINNANNKDINQKSKKMVLVKEIDQQKKDRMKSWVSFYRNNPSFCVEHYMGFKLYPYQRYIINLMAKSTNFMAYASRGSAKSMIIAVASICKCILWPGTKVTLNSATKSQAGLIISSYCQKVYDECPNVQREAMKPVCNQNKWEMIFFNSSKIQVIISGETGRGNRSSCVVLEERRLIPTEIIDNVIRPFSESRQPNFIKENPLKYGHLIEEPQELIISSVYYKSHDWYVECKKLLKAIANGDKDVKAVFLDYLISLKHGIKTKKSLQKEKIKMDSISWMQEYCNIPYSSSSSSYYKVGFFNRNIKVPWRPKKDDNVKKNIYDIPRKNGERRFIAVDLALRAGASNDNAIIGCARLFPTNKGWQTEICYLESHNGRNGLVLALRVKQLWEEFTNYADGDILILDIQNAGIMLYDALTGVTKDEVRGKEYDAMMVMRHDGVDEKVYQELKERSLTPNAKECIFPISGTGPLNSKIAVALRDRLKKKLLSFIIDDNAEEEFLIKTNNKDILDQDEPEMRAYLLASSIQTTLMINECIALDMSVISGNIKLQEPSGGRKDRFSMLAYLNFVCSLEDPLLLKEESEEDEWEQVFNSTFVF